MSSRKIDVLEIVSRYISGYFPLYDLKGKFYWERFEIRALLPVNHESAALARRLARRGRSRFQIRYTTAVDPVIAALQREDVKEHSWVKDQVVAIYHALQEAGLLRTIEAWTMGDTPQLAGALLGIVMPGTFIAETMFGLVPEASKLCLCQLVEDCHARGFKMIDVQTPHDIDEYGMPRTASGQTAHPCMRLGEQRLRIETYMRTFTTLWNRSFHGTAQDWITTARSINDSQITSALHTQALPYLSLAQTK